MSETTTTAHSDPSPLKIVGALVALVIAAAVIYGLYEAFRPAPPGTQRAQERLANLEALTTVDQEVLTSYGIVDADREVYRLPVREAMAMTVEQWKNPVAGRRELLSRLERATPETPAADASTDPQANDQAAP